MNKYFIISAVGIVSVIGIIYYLSTEDERNRIGGIMTYDETTPENISMGDGMHESHITNNDTTERSFLEHMIPHHEEAIATSKTVLNSGQANTEVNALARAIVSAQEKEITDMKSWYKTWYGEEYSDKGTYTPMMRDLSTLSGTELDRAFLEDMIKHHTEALLQAQAVAPAAEHQETLSLAQAIAETQSNEIITMRMLMKQIPTAAE